MFPRQHRNASIMNPAPNKFMEGITFSEAVPLIIRNMYITSYMYIANSREAITTVDAIAVDWLTPELYATQANVLPMWAWGFSICRFAYPTIEKSVGIGKGNPQKKKLEVHVELLSLHL